MPFTLYCYVFIVIYFNDIFYFLFSTTGFLNNIFINTFSNHDVATAENMNLLSLRYNATRVGWLVGFLNCGEDCTNTQQFNDMQKVL